jgi:RNA polymerase sigma factor (sigma-70 family)
MTYNEPDWDQIVEDVGPRLYRYFSASFSAATASDAVQETLIRLVQKTRQGEYKPAQGPLFAYAFGIAHWVRMEFLKKSSLTLVDDEMVFDQIPATGFVDSGNEGQNRLQHLRWAISQLKSAEQEIILLSIDSEMDLATIAVTLGVPLGTVKSHIHRAKENLKKIMEVHND